LRGFDRARASLLIADDRSKEWSTPSAVEFLVEKRLKKQLPRADVPSLVPEALALTAKAKDALGPFLSRFGQFLELDCQDAPAWYFNAINIVDCLDRASSLRREVGSIAGEAFFADKVPSEASVFKDPVKARSRIYVNRAAKDVIEKIVADAGLTGLEIGGPGRHRCAVARAAIGTAQLPLPHM
jgi:hypothetical protein